MAVLRQKTRLAKCIYYSRIVTTFLFSHVGLCALVLAYAFGGAFTFHYLEHNNEELVRNNTKAKCDELVAALWDLTENQTVLVYDTWTDGARKHLVEFERLLLHAVQNEGYDGELNLTQSSTCDLNSILICKVTNMVLSRNGPLPVRCFTRSSLSPLSVTAILLQKQLLVDW